MIQVGDRIPAATFKVMTADGPGRITTDELCKGKRVVLVGLPGAFTPTCHRNHVPGFIREADAIRARNVDTIAVTAVNDQFVMDAWAEASGGKDKLVFLADNNADFAKAVGLAFDATDRLGGFRSRRYAMLLDDGVVKVLNLEEEAGKAERTSAENLIKSL